MKTSKIRIWDIFCIIELILNFILIVLLFNQYVFGPSDHFLINQFCYGVTFGMILVIIPLLFGLCTGEQRPKKTGILVAISGALIFLGAGIFMIKEIQIQVKGEFANDLYFRLMAGAVLTCILGVIFLIHFLTVLTIIILKSRADSISVTMSQTQ